MFTREISLMVSNYFNGKYFCQSPSMHCKICLTAHTEICLWVKHWGLHFGDSNTSSQSSASNNNSGLNLQQLPINQHLNFINWERSTGICLPVLPTCRWAKSSSSSPTNSYKFCITKSVVDAKYRTVNKHIFHR